MKKTILITTLCCLLSGRLFAVSTAWNVDSGAWSVDANWTAGKPVNPMLADGKEYVDFRRTNAVCTLDTAEDTFNCRTRLESGMTLNVVDGGSVGLIGWNRWGNGSGGYINLSGNGTLITDSVYVGVGAGGNCELVMSDTSSLVVPVNATNTDEIYLASTAGSSASLKLIGSQVTFIADRISFTSGAIGTPAATATLEYVLDAGGVSKIVTDYQTSIGASGPAHLVLTDPGVTYDPNTIVLIQCNGTAAVSGTFTTMNGGPAAEGTQIALGGNLYALTYVYDANGDAHNNDVALVYARSTKHIAGNPDPADKSIQLVSPATLSWINPDPNQPGNSITCKVYFGQDPNRLNMDSITLAPDASSVAINAASFPTYGIQPLTNGTTYYWAVDCTENGVDPADGMGLYWQFSNDFNDGPVVDAGVDQVAWLGKSGTPGQEVINLAGTASDDGQPDPPGALTLAWSMVSGPAAVTPGPADATNASVTITVAGTYVFQLTADDSDKQTTDTVQVIVGNDSCHASILNGSSYDAMDFDEDCDVDMADLARFIASWLNCTDTLVGCN